MANTENLTPLLRQYQNIKNEHKDAILFFRMGDFYEMFFEDAVTASRVLEIALTTRDKRTDDPVPMCGIPYHAINSYLPKLIREGYKAAICEQVEDPAQAKGIVRREVVRIITPGTVLDGNLLESKENNFIACIYPDADITGLSFVDVSTGDFYMAELGGKDAGLHGYEIEDQIARIEPKEIILPEGLDNNKIIKNAERHRLYINPYPAEMFDYDRTSAIFHEHITIDPAELTTIDLKGPAINAAGALLAYLSETQKTALRNINSVKIYRSEQYMTLDESAQQTLELVRSAQSGQKKGTLFHLLDRTVTPMGGRLLKHWVLHPIMNPYEIARRQDAVEYLKNNYTLRCRLRESMQNVSDMERIISRVTLKVANARDLVSLNQCLKRMPDIKELFTAVCPDAGISDFHISDSLTPDSLTPDALTSDALTSDSLTSDALTSDSLSSDSLSSDSLSSDSLSSDALTSDALTSDSLSSDSLSSDSLTPDALTPDALTSDALTSDALTSDALTSDALTSDSLSSDALTSDALTSDSLTSDALTSAVSRSEASTSDAYISDALTSDTLMSSELIKNAVNMIDPVDSLRELLDKAIVDSPPLSITDGGVIKDGYNRELDELRQMSREGKGWIARLESRERQRSGIDSLKVRYNRVFGYYIEVTKTKLKSVPEDYTRKQTLVNAERFITPELKDYEARVLGAEDRSKALEYQLFEEIREAAAGEVKRIQRCARAIALIDVISTLSEVAHSNHYIRPVVDNNLAIRIEDGRHPVIEQIDMGVRFVPNDTEMDCETNQLMILTGPNMAGKSTYMRQVALIVLMAQIGSYVPARKASIGVVDRIFTRIGASDNLAEGRSTFMVEMEESANILRHATPRSLILLDEIGRGTSTFDGISIAWAAAEYINRQIKAKTLFATHYHELTELALTTEGIFNAHMAVREWNDEVIFLRKVMPDMADKSYGIQVARLAGLPPEVIKRAKEVLANLESEELDDMGMPKLAHTTDKENKTLPATSQIDLFSHGNESHPLIAELGELDIMNMTPLQALAKLDELKKRFHK